MGYASERDKGSLQFQQIIRSLLSNEKAILKDLQDEYKKMPSGTLYIKEKKGRMCFYEKTITGERGIKKDKEKIMQLARKRYLKEEIYKQEQNCEALGKVLQSIKTPKPYNRNTTDVRIRQLLLPEQYALSHKDFQWRNERYESNPYKMEQLRYQTQNGKLVRSKSERMIANKLEELQIPYRYEAKLAIEGKAYYPDFMLHRRDGTLLVWEHLGLMDQEDYYYTACRKLEKYRRAGFVQHTNLICTYENDIESEESLERIIQRYVYWGNL